MALKKRNKEEEVKVEEVLVAEVLTGEEKEVIQKAEEDKAKNSADTRRLQLATNLVSSQFNLDPSYTVNKFDDKGKIVNLTLENRDFIISVTIKDSEKHNMNCND